MKHLFKYRTVALLTLIVACARPASGQSIGQNDHLITANFDRNRYHQELFKILYKGFATAPIARFSSLPSNMAEYAFSVEKNGTRYLIRSNRMTNSYWGYWYRKYERHEKTKRSWRLKRSSVEINKELFEAIKNLFLTLQQQTIDPISQNTGLDGETSYFSTTVDARVKTGMLWSPSEGTAMRKAFRICKRVYLIGTKQDTSQTAVLADINLLKRELVH